MYQFSEAHPVRDATILVANNFFAPVIEEILGSIVESSVHFYVGEEEFLPLAVKVIRNSHRFATASFWKGANQYGRTAELASRLKPEVDSLLENMIRSAVA